MRTAVTRRILALGAGIATCAALVVAAPPATAAPFSTYGSGVNVRSAPDLDASVETTLDGPTEVNVECQTTGDTVTAEGITHDKWVYLTGVNGVDGYMTTIYIDHPESVLPDVPQCAGEEPPPPPPPPSGEVTLAELEAIYPDGRLGDPATVEEGLPSLNAAMADAEINTPARKSAFLATLLNESAMLYNADQATGETYTGRGYIQLTGDFNYGPAGDYLGVDLLGQPELALSLDYSAPIAQWYWTVARDINPMADDLDMAAVNVAIGYAPTETEDAERCADFEAALAYYNGSVPPGVNCTRGATSASSLQQAREYAEQERAYGSPGAERR